MIIGIDAGSLGVKDARLKVGVYQVAVNLFKALKKIDTENIYYLYSLQKIDTNLLKTFGENVKNIVVTPSKGWNKVWLPLRLLRDKPDIFIGLNNALPLKLPTQNYKSIVVIHDILFEKYPEFYKDSQKKLHRETKLSAQRADKIIAVSHAVRNDIAEIYKIDAEKIIVAYEGIREFPKAEEVKFKKPFFLFVGALKPQKNVPLLLQAFAKLQSSEELLLVGGDKWKDKKIEKTFKDLPKHVQRKIHFLGMVTDKTLASLYMHAIAFVSPSFSEGFGLPFVEAMSFGLPVIGPKNGSVPEVIGSAGILIDPTSEKELQYALGQMLNPKKHLQFAVKAKKQAKNFSWNMFAKKMLTVIESLW